MLFNSIDFAVFLPTVFLLYWFATNHSIKIQNIFLVAISYVFYGWWDWKFLSLIVLSTIIDYYCGLRISSSKTQLQKKSFLWLSILVNLGVLGVFKYYNFFVGNFVHAFSFFGVNMNAGALDIVLPVGISFYTFQTLSYTIDVYRKEIPPTRDFIAFSAYVSFFPQLVAGPIERAPNLLPQFFSKRIFNYDKSVDGMKQILWGLFKKIVIADNCAIYANIIFNNSDAYSGSTIFLGGVFFAFQIYGDFSGYSDIAIGTARLFGFHLKRNFAFPYFSRDIAEFWRRWHISLSSWFKDYLYFPLGGSKRGMATTIRNILIIFIVSGLWHGANWTFIIWGALNAIYFLPLLLIKKNRANLQIVAEESYFPSIKDLINIFLTFSMVTIAWIVFRAENIVHAKNCLSRIFSLSILTIPNFTNRRDSLITVCLVAIFMIIEWHGRKQEYAIANLGIKWRKPLRYAMYYTIAMSILIFGNFNQNEFIYFQF